MLQAIQDGYRLFTQRAAIGTSEAAGLWQTFFKAASQQEPDTVLRSFWGPAEQAGTQYGIQQADARVGRPGGFTGLLLENFIAAGNVYRDLVGKPGAAGVIGATSGFVMGNALCDGPCAVTGGAVGHNIGEWFTDPRSTVAGTGRGPTYFAAWGVVALTVNRAIYNPGLWLR